MPKKSIIQFKYELISQFESHSLQPVKKVNNFFHHVKHFKTQHDIRNTLNTA